MSGTSGRPVQARGAGIQRKITAAYDMLEAIRFVLHGRAEDAGHLLPPFVMAAASAADARDALAFAPSLAIDLAADVPLDVQQLAREDGAALAAILGEAARVLGTRLALAALTAADAADRAALVAASQHAAIVHSQLAGPEAAGGQASMGSGG